MLLTQLILGVVILFFHGEVSAEFISQREILWEVHVAKEDEKVNLRVRLTNEGCKAISFYEHYLPWKYRYAMQVYAFKAFWSSDGILEEALPMVESGRPREITLNPKESLEGVINLNERFPTLHEELRVRPVTIFWILRLKLIGSSQMIPKGGWALINSNK